MAIIAVDWGTTHLRVWAIDAQGHVLATRRGDQGMSRITRADYPQVLADHAQTLGAAPDTPAIVCGMAGSRQGWCEAAYLPLPLDLAELAAGSRLVDGQAREIRILPGAMLTAPDRADVMRSEETQIAGLRARGHTDCDICMPGTHTKWVTLESGRIADFSTTMTGEVFSMMEQHSILRHSIDANLDALTPDMPDFIAGVAQGLDAPAQLVTRLFGLRAAVLAGGHVNVRARLSGLLIGADVGAMVERRSGRMQGAKIILVGGNPLGASYRVALEMAGFAVDEHDGEALAIEGLVAAARTIWPARFKIDTPMRKGA